MKNKLFSLIARVTAVATILSTFAMTAPVKSADLESASDTLSRLAISESANHDIRFYTPTGIDAASDVTITFAAGFDLTGIVDADIDFNVSPTVGSDCGSYSNYADSASADSAAAQVVTINPSANVVAGRCVQVLIGDNTTGGANQIENPGTPATYLITIGGTFDDGGAVAVPIVDDDQVTVTANVDPSMLFDLDTSISTSAETAAPYTVDFGTLDPTGSGVNASGETLTHGDIHYIHMDLETNATNGAVVTIQNANGANGMVSTSDGTDNIANAAVAEMAQNTENYGFCVGGTYQTSGAAMTTAWGSHTSCENNYDGTDDGTANDTVALTVAAANIITVAGPVAGGEAYLIGSADASVLTEAHDDYVDTLTFIATATF